MLRVYFKENADGNLLTRNTHNMTVERFAFVKSSAKTFSNLEAMSKQNRQQVCQPHSSRTDDEKQQSQGRGDRSPGNRKMESNPAPDKSRNFPTEVVFSKERATSIITEQLLHEAVLSLTYQQDAQEETTGSAMTCALAKHGRRQTSWPFLFTMKYSRHRQVITSRERCIQGSRRVQRQTRKKNGRAGENESHAINDTLKKRQTSPVFEIVDIDVLLPHELRPSPSSNNGEDGDDDSSLATNHTLDSLECTKRRWCASAANRILP